MLSLILNYEGWVQLRLPTDPDPQDEPRGISGYTFAFAGEPDLDRILRLQPYTGMPLRSYSPTVGVKVTKAQTSAGKPIPALVGATVDLLDDPILQNRNWNLTLPGFEPIVPFHMHIQGGGIVLDRTAPLNLADPTQPVYEVPDALLAAQGAAGMAFEPDTIGEATGIYDSLAVVTTRLANLQADLQQLGPNGDPVKIANLEGRIAELQYAVTNAGDRRVVARYFVERFGFPVMGTGAIVKGQPGGKVDTSLAWSVYFWLGAWDPDLLCLYMKGTFEAPYTQSS